MADKNPTVDGLIDLGYEAPDYSCPTPASGNGKQKMHTVFPTFRVCKEPAEELHKALNSAKLLDGEFAAIVVLKNSMVRVSDDDEDEDPSKDVEMEFVVKALMPHADGGSTETEDAIMADFDKLPKPTKDAGESDDDGEEDED